MKLPRRISDLAIAVVALVSAGAARAHAAPQTPPSCKNFGLVSEWKGTLSLVGTGSGTLSDGGTYNINESITASPDINAQGAGSWTGNFNETIHIDDLESHPDGTFTHITDDESIPQGPISATAGGFLPGAGLNANLSACTFEFDWDPSLHVTITSNSGTETGTPSQYGFVGLQQSGSVTFNVGSIQSPLPTSGLVLSGNAAVSYFSALLGDPANWTLTWSLNPVLDLDLIVTIPQYSTWRPTAGLTELDTGVDDSGRPNLLTIQALLVKKSTQQPVDFPPDNVTFLLASPSHQPGVSMNWPPKSQLISPAPSDLSFDKNQAANANYQINADGTQAQISPTTPPVVAPVTIVLSPHDWGGWAALNVTATAAGQTIEGHFAGDPSNYLVLPKRQPGLYTADVWKDAHGIALSTPDTDDSEPNPEGRPDCLGDGLTLYEEYRGFMENGKHIEGDPTKKDFFIQNLIGGDAEDGLDNFVSISNLVVHKDLTKDEMDGIHQSRFTLSATLGNRLINFNHLDNDPTHVTDQHGVIIVTCSTGGLSNPFHGGGLTLLTVDGVHGHPGITQYICLEDPFRVGGQITPDNTHRGIITPAAATLQYRTAMAHELLHSVGVDHHGDTDLRTKRLTFYSPNDPANPTGQPSFLLGDAGATSGFFIRLLREKDGQDEGALLWQVLQTKLAVCQTLPLGLVPEMVVDWCKRVLAASHYTIFPYVGEPHGQHSGNDSCVMRYWFSNLYPSEANGSVYYDPTDGTEQVGYTMCTSPAGTGVNDPSHPPQPRYFEASPGRGSCKFWVCVSDAYANVSDQP
jgi:hypothetical protein